MDLTERRNEPYSFRRMCLRKPSSVVASPHETYGIVNVASGMYKYTLNLRTKSSLGCKV